MFNSKFAKKSPDWLTNGCGFKITTICTGSQTTNICFSHLRSLSFQLLSCSKVNLTKQPSLWQKVVRKLVRVSALKRQADTFINLGLTEIDGISPAVRGSVLTVPIPGVTVAVSCECCLAGARNSC